MQARLLLPALWLLSLLLPAPCLRAQGRPLGPWRVVVRKVRGWKTDGWGAAKEDTATHLVSEAAFTLARWDVEPDSIRLFLNCENPLIAPVQPRKGQISIRFAATGATVRLDAKEKMLFIAPFASRATLWAYRGQALLFKHEFKVVPPPLPTLEYYCNLNPVFTKGGQEIYPCSVKAIPTPEFAQFLSSDALFRLSKGRITLVRNGVPAYPPIPFSWYSVDITELRKLANAGDQLKVDVDLVERMNFCGDIEVVPLTKQYTITVP